jgi:polysaccharide biosynthesis/export protein
MKSNRIRESLAPCLQGRGHCGKWWQIGLQSVVCLMAVCLLAACGASNPSKESVSNLQPRDAAVGAYGMPTGVEGTDPFSPGSPSSIAQIDDYQIGPFDLLRIDVFQVPELSHSAQKGGVRVNSQGFISLPLLGPIQVSGLTSQQLEVYLAKLLEEKYLQDPQVSVFIEEFTNQRVTVGGGVKRPGIYPIQGRITLLQAIAGAEGASFEASRGRGSVRVLRMTDAGLTEISSYSLNALHRGKIPDPEIHNDDIVMVDESAVKIFFSRFFRFFINPLALF